MTWLAPLFLAAGLTVAAPILFHMWQRTPRGRRLFSSTMFLAPSPPRITQRSRIENWPLLLLRALALVLLAVGFSRPIWRMAEQAPTISSPDKTVAILVDASASLRRTGFWDDLARQVSARLDSLPASTHLGLFAFDHGWRAVVPLDEADQLDLAARRQFVAEQLSSLQPGWGATRLGQGLSQTLQALREFSASRPVKEASEIWLVSDLAAGADLAGLAGIDWPETMKLELITPQLPPGTNAGLQWIESNTADKASPRRVRVSNAQSSSRDRFRLGWETGELVEIHVPAGQSRTLLAPERPANLDETAPLVLTGDDHEFDNRLWLAAGRRRAVWILYLGNETADDIAAPRFFLEQALAGTPDADVTVRSLKELDAKPAAGSPAFQGQGRALLSVDPPVLTVWTDAGVEPPQEFQEILNRGGSLLAVPKTPDDARQMLAYLGLAVDTAEAEVKDFSLLSDIDFEDPLFATFLQARFADFTGIHFWKHRRVTLSETFDGRVLAKFDDGSPFVVYQTKDAGRWWLLTSGWQPADSQLARSSKFAPLLQRMLEQSTPLSSGASRGPVGSEISWPLARGDGDIAVTRPDQKTESVAEDYARTDVPGLYRAARNGETASWAIHIAPEESKTDPLPKETLERLHVLLKRPDADQEAIASPAQQRQLQLEELERRQALWRWCLLAAGIVLLAETAWAARKAGVADISTKEDA